MDLYLQIADAINKEISSILQAALAGYNDAYKIKRDGRIYIQWGKVEEDIFNAVIKNLTEDR